MHIFAHSCTKMFAHLFAHFSCVTSMATIKFYLDIRRSKNSASILKIAITQDRKCSYISLNVRLTPNQWDARKERVKDHPEKQTLNSYLLNIRSRLENLLIMFAHDGTLRLHTAASLKEKFSEEIFPDLKRKKQDQTTFLYRFMKYAERMKPGSKRIFDHTLNRLTVFKGSDYLQNLKFEDMTVEWMQEFDNFMAKTSSQNSRNIHFRNIRAVFNEAIEDNITSSYPFRRFKIKREVTPNRDLTVEELRRLIYYDCEECAVRYRDYFILMFFLMGINNVDLCNLRQDNISSKGRLEFYRTKTHHFFSMKIEPEAKALIDKYRGEEWLLDILDHWSSDEYFRKKMNKHLQKIGPVTRSGLGGKKTYAPMFPKLTTYYARHTWATIASSLDVPIETISAGLGHEYGNPTTIIYIHKDDRKVDKANRKVIDWVLYGKIDGKEAVKPGTPEFYGLGGKEAESLGLIK